MQESELNTIINKSIARYERGLAEKIPDATQGMGTKRPFDSFGAFNEKALYMEVKLIKGIYSFNFNKIKDHQFINLLAYKKYIDNSICIVPVGFYKPRKFLYILWFDISTIYDLTKKGKKSIVKQELQNYINQGKFLEVKSEKIGDKRCKYVQDIERLEEVII